MLVLTNMCLIVNEDNKYLTQNRTKNDWPGLNLPGGHVEENETIIESVKREIKEETNLELIDVEFVNYFEWFNPKTNRRDLVLLFKSNKFNGTIHDSSEGHLRWMSLEEIKKESLSLDLDKVLALYGLYF